MYESSNSTSIKRREFEVCFLHRLSLVHLDEIPNTLPTLQSTRLTGLKSVGDEASFNLLLEAAPDIIPNQRLSKFVSKELNMF